MSEDSRNRYLIRATAIMAQGYAYAIDMDYWFRVGYDEEKAKESALRGIKNAHPDALHFRVRKINDDSIKFHD